MTYQEFVDCLSSKSPTPGGGGASALMGAIGVALCSMVGELTSGKKKYAAYQQELDTVSLRTKASIQRLLQLIEMDAAVFEPLSAAYGIPKEDPQRESILENALRQASTVPQSILLEIYEISDMLERLTLIGTRLAVSDIGCAAAACSAAAQGAYMNILANTKLMKDQAFAQSMNHSAAETLKSVQSRCQNAYQAVRSLLEGNQ